MCLPSMYYLEKITRKRDFRVILPILLQIANFSGIVLNRGINYKKVISVKIIMKTT